MIFSIYNNDHKNAIEYTLEVTFYWGPLVSMTSFWLFLVSISLFGVLLVYNIFLYMKLRGLKSNYSTVNDIDEALNVDNQE